MTDVRDKNLLSTNGVDRAYEWRKNKTPISGKLGTHSNSDARKFRQHLQSTKDFRPEGLIKLIQILDRLGEEENFHKSRLLFGFQRSK